jgi:hypothetical protein
MEIPMSKSAWNDVVQAYEESIEALEAARNEYEAAVQKTIDAMQSEAKDSLEDVEPQTRIEWLSEDNEGLGQRVLSASVKADDIVWVVVETWVASAFGGPTATLRIVSRLEEQKVFDVVDQARGFMSDTSDWSKVPQGGGDEEFSDDTNYFGIASIDLRDGESLRRGSEKFAEFVKNGLSVAKKLAAGTAPLRCAMEALKQCRASIQKTPTDPDQSVSPSNNKLSAWQGLQYFQIDRKELPGIWVGVHPEHGFLMYGHNNSAQYPQLATDFARKLGVAPTAHGSFPAGVLLDDKKLKSATQAEIAGICERAFRLFVEMTPAPK